MRQLVVLLPCYNEELALPGLLTDLAAVGSLLNTVWQLAVLVVDDGSNDRTAHIAGQGWAGLPVHLTQHAVNQGLGRALQTGITWFLNHCACEDTAVLAVMDADGTHPPELLTEMLAKLQGDPGPAYDVVIASRYVPGGEEHGLSLMRRGYSRLASAAMMICGRVQGARDYSCGYRLYRYSILKRAAEHYHGALVTESGFTCMAELLIKLWRSGAVVGEVPLKLHYELKAGASKMNVVFTIRRYFYLAWQMLFNPGWR